MLDIIEYKGDIYPSFQSKGNAMQFAYPYASHMCKGIGLDVGCNKIEWGFQTNIIDYYSNSEFSKWKELANKELYNNDALSYPIDPLINKYDALNFPSECINLDYIISSHCLEHLDNWVDVLDYWTSLLKTKGVLFLYLPDYSQKYWRPWNNRKHKNIFNSDIISDYMLENGYEHIFKSGIDLNNSFFVVGIKK